jgi:protein-ribulosamine 3-kinase
MTSTYLQIFESVFFESFGHDVEIEEFSVVASGAVNTGAKLVTSEGTFFVKLNELEIEDFFHSEAADLGLLRPFLRVPAVIGSGKTFGHNYLITEFINLNLADPQKSTFEMAGAQLANLHLNTSPQFGLDHNNFLSSLPQDNQWKTDGINFLIQNRILPMVGRCLMEEKISIDLYKRIENLYGRLGKIIPDDAPALLHGDLWSGNLISDKTGFPIYIDPSCYFGLRESELAFTYLFGGFENSFYEAYLDVFPLEPGFGERVSVYHIHPLLVHVLLFGSGYIAGIERILKRFS